MSYQVGQAVIIRWDKNTEYIGTFESQKGATIHTGGLFNANDSGLCNTESVRPATEAEILAEAVKHGWIKDKNGNYDHKTKAVWIFFHPDLKRYVINSDPYEVEDYSIFGQECITAHRLITALNLAKK